MEKVKAEVKVKGVDGRGGEVTEEEEQEGSKE